jgi:hypothetical protein
MIKSNYNIYFNRMQTDTTTRTPMNGGAGAADHAISTYGGIGEHHAASTGGNVIGAKSVGGKRKRRKGGNALAELAVPVALLIANHQYGKRTRVNKPMRSRKSRKNTRRSRRYRR